MVLSRLVQNPRGRDRTDLLFFKQGVLWIPFQNSDQLGKLGAFGLTMSLRSD
ncbi:hypothetical protein K2X85_13205 [bacterium]|nr:hypothetical protein [bacterium]